MSRVKSREYAFRLVFEKFFHEPDDELMFEFDDIVIDTSSKSVYDDYLLDITEMFFKEKK